MDTIEIEFENKNKTGKIAIEKEKLMYVLSRLENNTNLKLENQEQIINLMKKFDLFDKYFLENINKI